MFKISKEKSVQHTLIDGEPQQRDKNHKTLELLGYHFSSIR